MPGELKIALENYSRLLQTHQYHFVVGRKGIATDITIDFSKDEFFHLLGLQYVKHFSNNYELKRARSIIYDNLSDPNNPLSIQIETSEDYPLIKERVLDASEIEKILDKSTEIYKFNPQSNGASKIDADFIVKFTDENKWTYLFLSEKKGSGHYFCRSVFSRDKSSKKDFTNGHTKNSFLLKEKIHIPTGRVEQLYRAKSYNPNVQSAPKTESFSINNFGMTPRPILASADGAAVALDFAQPPHGNLSFEPIKKFFSVVAKPFKTYIEKRRELKATRAEIRLLEDKLGNAESKNALLQVKYDLLSSNFDKKSNEYSEKIEALNKELDEAKTELESVKADLKKVTELSDKRGELIHEANRILNDNPELKCDYIRARDEHRNPPLKTHGGHDKPDKPDRGKPRHSR